MKMSRQMSETLRVGMILAVSGGFMDAYSYLCRDHVFANAQTGNMLLLGVHLSQGDVSGAFQYLCPVAAFTIGIIVADILRYRMDDRQSSLHWRQCALLIEAMLLLGVAFIPFRYNLLANSIISLTCGIQVESFRKIHDNGIATTMCIGNLRSGTQNLCEYIFKKDRSRLRKSLLYYGIIGCFMLGAVMGSIVILWLQEKSILMCSGILCIAFVMLHGKRQR
ncbi:MAG: DUF1275 domain-containing protein [Eubacterium sp.]|nr:DUF1275 domain-containing protein [Eubacterium sp.]